MDNEFYRKKAIENRKNRWSGNAFLPKGTSLWIVSIGAVIFMSAIISFLSFGTYTRRVTVTGEIISEPRSVTVIAPQQGFITKQLVNVGNDVKSGQALYLLNSSKRTTSGIVDETQIQSINAQIQTLQNILIKNGENKESTIHYLKEQISNYEAVIEQTKKNLKNAEAGMIFMEKNMKNYRSYLEHGLINKEQLINQTSLFYDRQNDLVSYNNQLSQYSLQVINLNSELKSREIDFDNKASGIIIQKNDLQRQISEIEANGSIVIPAPTSGRVESNSVTEGEMVSAGDSLIQILPGSVHRYVLVLWVPAHAAPYVTKGDLVNIRYDAFPSDKFGQFPGKVLSISSVPASMQEMATYPSAPAKTTNSPETWYKLIVLPNSSVFHYNGKALGFNNGMKANSILFLEKRKLYQWILSPIYNIKNSMAEPSNDK